MAGVSVACYAISCNQPSIGHDQPPRSLHVAAAPLPSSHWSYQHGRCGESALVGGHALWFSSGFNLTCLILEFSKEQTMQEATSCGGDRNDDDITMLLFIDKEFPLEKGGHSPLKLPSYPVQLSSRQRL